MTARPMMNVFGRLRVWWRDRRAPWRHAWCPQCCVERTDYEDTTAGPQYLDECPQCGCDRPPVANPLLLPPTGRPAR